MPLSEVFMPSSSQISREKQSECEEVIDVLCDALEITQKLADEAHGELSAEVYSLAAVLHEALRKAANIYKIITVSNRSVARFEKENNKAR
jgi:hypothetical protein